MSGVPINGTGRLLEVVRCRGCGAQGLEEDTDVCPGLCPACLDVRLDMASTRFATVVKRDGIGAGLASAYTEMVGFGMTDAAAKDLLAEAVVMAHRPETSR